MNTIDSKKYTLIDLFRDTEGGGRGFERYRNSAHST